MIDSGLFMNTDNEKLVSDLNDVFKQFSVTPQEQEEIMKEVGVNVKIESIASAIAKFLYSAKSKIDILDYEVREENKGKNTRHDDLISYKDLVKNEIKSNLKVQENFDSKSFKEEYIQNAYDRIKAKLNNLNNEELILGVEFILDGLIAQREYDAYSKQFEEKVELEDVFESEAIANIENHLAR